jgi:hypothetical protein
MLNGKEMVRRPGREPEALAKVGIARADVQSAFDATGCARHSPVFTDYDFVSLRL